MDLNKMNEDWKNETPTLAAMEVVNPFTVPDNYFDDLSELIQARVKIDEVEGDGSLKLFAVPEGYFESLEERIIASIVAERFKNEVPVEGFEVPEGYFNKLHNEILAKTAAVGKAKVRQMFPAWAKYAAAACISAIVASGIYFNSTMNSSNSIENKLSSIPEADIVNYLEVYSSIGDGEVITEHLEKTNNLPQGGTDLSEKEIKEYLESTL